MCYFIVLADAIKQLNSAVQMIEKEKIKLKVSI